MINAILDCIYEYFKRKYGNDQEAAAAMTGYALGVFVCVITFLLASIVFFILFEV